MGVGGAFRVRQPGADPPREPAAIELLDDGRSPARATTLPRSVSPRYPSSPAGLPGILSIWRRHRRYSARPC